MISIFNGGSRTLLHSTPADTFIQIHHTIMPYLNIFSSSDWMVFTTTLPILNSALDELRQIQRTKSATARSPARKA